MTRPDGKQHGQRTYTYSGGDETVYVGQWKDRDRHGQGTFTLENGSGIEGQWKYGELHGPALIKGADGTIYEGQFKGVLNHGRGTLTSNCGIIFDGPFARESFRNGTFTLPDGVKIEVKLKTAKPTSKVKIIRAKTNEEIEWRKLKKIRKVFSPYCLTKIVRAYL